MVRFFGVQVKTRDEYTEEEAERARRLANELADATVRYLNSNLSNESEEQIIKGLRQELEEMGFIIRCVNSFSLETNAYSSEVTLLVPKSIQ